VINPAWKHELIKCSSTAFKPGQKADAGGCRELELDRFTGLFFRTTIARERT
jgi:hypothetical protein